MLLFFALLWGFAEATLFFIVPDVLITYAALFGLPLALFAALFSLLGALIGGTLMYRLGAKSSALFPKIPGITPSMIEHVKKELVTKKDLAVFLGPIKGIPYKLYASFAPKAGIPFWRFFLVSIPARFTRFLIAAVAAHFINVYLLSSLALWLKLTITTLFWIAFYIWYLNALRARWGLRVCRGWGGAGKSA